MDAFRHSQGKGERGRNSLSLSLSHQRGTRVAAPHQRPGAKTEVRESLSVPLFLSLASKGGHGPQLLTRKPACLWDQVQRETRVAAPPKACPRRSERGPTQREARARGSQLSLSRASKGDAGRPERRAVDRFLRLLRSPSNSHGFSYGFPRFRVCSAGEREVDTGHTPTEGERSYRIPGGLNTIPTSSPDSSEFLWVLLWVPTLSCVFCRREIGRDGAYTARGGEVRSYPGRMGSHAFACDLPERDR